MISLEFGKVVRPQTIKSTGSTRIDIIAVDDVVRRVRGTSADWVGMTVNSAVGMALKERGTHITLYATR